MLSIVCVRLTEVSVKIRIRYVTKSGRRGVTTVEASSPKAAFAQIQLMESEIIVKTESIEEIKE